MKKFPAVTLDTSHLAVSGIDIIRAFDELQDRVVHIHLSNNLGTGRDTHSPLTQGVLPIGSLLKRIAAAGYSGTITLELDVREWASKPAQLASVLRDQREFCLDRLGTPAGA
jgi:sugar phosphate isomerase/epimerase